MNNYRAAASWSPGLKDSLGGPALSDHFPIISGTDIPGFYVAAGHEGDGIGLSLITGKLIAQMISREPLAISVDPLKLSRFKDKQKDIDGFGRKIRN